MSLHGWLLTAVFVSSDCCCAQAGLVELHHCSSSIAAVIAPLLATRTCIVMNIHSQWTVNTVACRVVLCPIICHFVASVVTSADKLLMRH